MCALHSAVRISNTSAATSNQVAAGARLRAASDRTTPDLLRPPEGRILKILEMIQSERIWHIDDLARQLNLSHSYLAHLFKEQTGVPLGQLLTEQRLRRAADLLLHTNLRIKEIAQAVGYEHTSSFVRAFERLFTKPPRLYRQEPAEGQQETPAERSGLLSA